MNKWDREPTQEQISEFWLRCGFIWVKGTKGICWRYEQYKEVNYWWEAPNGKKYLDPPELDLNNLWRSAVPKAITYLRIEESLNEQAKRKQGYEMIFALWAKELYIVKDPALALFRVLGKLILNHEPQQGRIEEVK